MGAPHRIPLTTIRKNPGWEMVCDWPAQTFVGLEQPLLVWYKQLEVMPEIVEEERGPALNLWAEQRLFFPGEYLEVLKLRSHDWARDIGQRAQTHLTICCHQHDIGQHVAELLESPQSLQVSSPKLRQCDVCLTAYVFVLKGHHKGSFQIILSTWISLGSCRFSFSPAWLTSSWLSRGHTWIRDPTIAKSPRPFHNDYSDFHADTDLTRAVRFKRDDIIRPSDMLWRLRPLRSEIPEHEFVRTDSVTSTMISERDRDREVTDAAHRVPAQIEEQSRPSRRRFS